MVLEKNSLSHLVMVTEQDLRAKAICNYLQKNINCHASVVSGIEDAYAVLNIKTNTNTNTKLAVDSVSLENSLVLSSSPCGETDLSEKALSENAIDGHMNDHDHRPITLFLLDVAFLDATDVYKWCREFSDYDDVVFSLFNVANEDDAFELMTVGKIDGVIYKTLGLDEMEKGVSFLLGGHMWLSRGLMARLIGKMRGSSAQFLIDDFKLTRRETQLLKLIGIGVCNGGIAERLFISEYTVRTHIYNIYKKIGVHNREEARVWVKTHFFDKG